MIRKAGAVSLAFALMAQAVLADPSRVLVIGGTAAEIVAALGQSERLVARDATTTFPPGLMALPDVGGRKPVSIRMVVVLPAPFGPRNPVTWPGLATNEMSFTAVTEPYFLVRF